MAVYRFCIKFVALSLLSHCAHAAVSQTVNTSKALVIVNKETITQSDLDQRVKLLTLTGGLSHQNDISDSLKAEILKSLIQEKLQIHAARAKKIVVKDDEVDGVIANIAKENNLSLNEFVASLKKNGVQKDTMASRIKAQMIWARYIRSQFQPLIHVSEIEADREIQNIKNRKDKKQYLISEITLMASEPKDNVRVLADANKIIGDLRQGANFSALAQQLSKDASSNRGGDLGWLSIDQVDPAVVPAIEKLSPGGLSTPIRTGSGYKIIKLRDIRKAGEADPGEAEVAFCQVLFPIQPDSPEEVYQEVGPQVQEVLSTTGCGSYKSLAKQYGFNVDETSKVKLNQLPDHLNQLLRTTAVGKCTQPVMTPQGLVGTMLCAKNIAKSTLPTQEEVMHDIEQEKISKISIRELRKIEATAAYEFKDAAAQKLLGK